MKWIRVAAWPRWALLMLLLLSACANQVDTEPVALGPQLEPRPGPSAHYYQPGPRDERLSSGVRGEIARWFVDAGYKEFQVAALIEHAKIESGFRPCASAPGFRYTFQWSGTRLRRLYEFASTGGSCPPLEKQLAFADNELRSVPEYACFWNAQSKDEALSALRRGFGHGRC
jgi:hypothetical protein